MPCPPPWYSLPNERTNFPCRSVYLPVIRNDLPELFDVFDFADPHTTTGSRPQTMAATQGLFILKPKFVPEPHHAEMLISGAAFLGALYRRRVRLSRVH